MRYLTYDEYVCIGGKLEKPAFERVIVAACMVIDRHTQNRLRGVSEPSEAVLACIRDLCEYIYDSNDRKSQTVSSRSQSAGGVSESETYTAKTGQEVMADMYDIMYQYLAPETDDLGTPLMYRGCMV